MKKTRSTQRRRSAEKRQGKITLGQMVEAAHAAGADVKISLAPLNEPAESTDARNERILAQAMAGKRRLTLADAQHLAAGFMVKKRVAETWRETAAAIQKDLQQLEKDCQDRRRLCQPLMSAAREKLNYVGAEASAVVWNRASDLIAEILRKHFPQNLAECNGITAETQRTRI